MNLPPPIEEIPVPRSLNLGITVPINVPPDFDPQRASVIDDLFEQDRCFEKNIREIFRQFNIRFFYSKVKHFTLRVSTKIKADLGRTDLAKLEIVLAKVVLLENRKLWIETLLHQMIHAYLWEIGVSNAKNGGHDLEFMNEAARINREAICQVDAEHPTPNLPNLQKYVYVCKKCRLTVYRRLRRQPNTGDIWFFAHRNECGGEFKLTTRSSTDEVDNED
ncbi:DNA-dependent metalloprotease dvc-1-like [Diachasmimorpha longicaudata]|uniref:DNA-dependent metalloprotease dvc-1-like n=1 Tax=Diachasmimorpha longicaudata TaxID=58733 RepID=UPI0030B89B9C